LRWRKTAHSEKENNRISKIKAGLIISPISEINTPAKQPPAKNKLTVMCEFSLLTKLLPFNLEN
jgi:hypothetical protein